MWMVKEDNMEGLKVGKLAAARPLSAGPSNSSFRVFPHQPEIGILATKLFSFAQPCVSKHFWLEEVLVKLPEMT